MTNRYITLCQIFLKIMKSHLLFIVLPVPFVINFLFIRKQSVTPLCSVGKWLPKIFFVYSALIMDTLKESTGFLTDILISVLNVKSLHGGLTGPNLA